jgi:hypothetical protein
MTSMVIPLLLTPPVAAFCEGPLRSGQISSIVSPLPFVQAVVA